jgi:hypothetical protein
MQFESPEWPSILHRIVTVPHQISDPVLNPPTSKSPGNAWKRVLAADISAHAESCIDNDTETNHFLKLDHFGLSGVIFYRSPAKGETLEEGQMDDAVSVVASGTSTHFPTETDELERILGQTAARLVYLPNHACTSFVVSIPPYSAFFPFRLFRVGWSSDELSGALHHVPPPCAFRFLRQVEDCLHSTAEPTWRLPYDLRSRYVQLLEAYSPMRRTCNEGPQARLSARSRHPLQSHTFAPNSTSRRSYTPSARRKTSSCQPFWCCRPTRSGEG